MACPHHLVYTTMLPTKETTDQANQDSNPLEVSISICGVFKTQIAQRGEQESSAEADNNSIHNSCYHSATASTKSVTNHSSASTYEEVGDKAGNDGSQANRAHDE